MEKSVEILAKKYLKYIDLYKKESPKCSLYESEVWGIIGSDLSLGGEEILFLASKLPQGEIDDLTNDFMGFLVKSPNFKKTNIFSLKNFGDPLLDLKSEAILAGNKYKFSSMKDDEEISLENFWSKVESASSDFINIDIDYMLAMISTGKVDEPTNVDLEKIKSNIKDSIAKNKYKYLYYFEYEGLEALAAIGLHPKKKAQKQYVWDPPKDWDPTKNWT